MLKKTPFWYWILGISHKFQTAVPPKVLGIKLRVIKLKGNSRKNEGDFNHQKYIIFWYSRKWQIRKRRLRGRALIPEKMSENGPVRSC